MAKAVININLDAKCRRCGKGGATQSGVCMACMARGVKTGEFDEIIERYKPRIRSK